MNSIINTDDIMVDLRSRWDPRGDVVVFYTTPPKRFKNGVVYINCIYQKIDMILVALCGLKISKVFYTENGIDFKQIKIAPSNS